MKRAILVGILCCIHVVSHCQTINHPFPNHTQYAKGSIKPTHPKQAKLDSVVIKFYDFWKKSYIKNDCSASDHYYVYTDEGDTKDNIPTICVSEGQGFGMVIVPLMAGYDKDAQTIYDGMYRFVMAHPTAKSQDLMSWSISKGCITTKHKTEDEYDNTSATDGDLDITLSLFIADAQWGSNGAINYKEEGVKRAKAILDHEINRQKHTVLLSDANDPGDYDFFDIRTSDFMPTHLKVFNKYYPSPEWNLVVNKTYQIFAAIQSKYSPKVGLLPDFITYKNNKYIPAKPNYLESPNDGAYYYNACRIPFRVGLDYLINGDTRAQQLLNPLTGWVQTKTRNSIDKLTTGFYLNGQAIPKHSYTVPSFVCPMAVGSMLNSENQEWLNDSGDYIDQLEVKDYKYYDNTIQMLSLIALSGNFWLP